MRKLSANITPTTLNTAQERFRLPKSFGLRKTTLWLSLLRNTDVFFVGNEVRLYKAYYVTCTGYDLDENGEVCCVHATYDPETFGGDSPDGRKVKGTIHWVSAKENVPCEVRLYERLFNVANPSDEEGVSSFEDNLNPDSLKVVSGYVEKALLNCEVGAKYQFMRNGYFCKDKDSTDEKPVFNRTVALRDSFKITK